MKVQKPDHRYTFSGAKTAATFSQLNADLLRYASSSPLAALEASGTTCRGVLGSPKRVHERACGQTSRVVAYLDGDKKQTIDLSGSDGVIQYAENCDKGKKAAEVRLRGRG